MRDRVVVDGLKDTRLDGVEDPAEILIISPIDWTTY